MGNTMATITFQISYVTPIFRLLIRVISTMVNYLSDLVKILYMMQLKDGEYTDSKYLPKFLYHNSH